MELKLILSTPMYRDISHEIGRFKVLDSYIGIFEAFQTIWERKLEIRKRYTETEKFGIEILN